MMIKKKAKDTTRKNVARSSAIMMTHPRCWLVFSTRVGLGVLDFQWTESEPNMMGKFYPPHITTSLHVDYESVTF
ncbi:hypothetical protein AYO43_00235 [Nitrospira sp. SCGC AG-212-E16]|nr:hypothetical protein AYO43_00235 [Nitrospira sp. SCGC AG-212-E16]